MQTNKAVVSVQRMDSEEFKGPSEVPHYATEEERMKAMNEFNHEQLEVLRRHHDED